MPNTSLSLLFRLHSIDDEAAWNLLVATYRPLLETWLAQLPVQACDRDDLLQDVFVYVSQSVRSFEHNGHTGAFRNWLRQILSFRLQQFWKRVARQPQAIGGSELLRYAQELADPSSGISRLWDEEHDRHVVGQLLDHARRHFSSSTWSAFEQVVLRGQSPSAVAQELGLTVNAVFVAKSRVLAHLRHRGGALIE